MGYSHHNRPDKSKVFIDYGYSVVLGSQRSKMPNALEVKGLTVQFGGRKLFSNLSFSVSQGASLAIIGPNGSGKTILLRSLIESIPFQGQILWAAGTKIGYVPQKLDIERDVPMTGIDFLRARATLAKNEAKIGDVLGLVGIPIEIANRSIGNMSGGQFQRLLIAFALLGDPNVLLLDEPTAGVDEPGQLRLNELMHRLREEQGLTVLFISHELSVVYQYATNVLCLGQMQACFGAPRTILTPALLQQMYGTPVDFHFHER